jgi:hypothetical protein
MEFCKILNVLLELSHNTLFLEKRSTCSAGASCSHIQGFAKNSEIEDRLEVETPGGIISIIMRQFLMRFRNAGDEVRKEGEVRRTIGHVGPRTDA